MRAVAVILLAGFAFCGCAIVIEKETENRFLYKVGFSKTVITPSESLPMGGFLKRKGPSQGVHDDLHARATVLEDKNGNRIALVSVDLIGFLRHDVLRVQKEFDFPVYVFATHNHSGPDTIGIFGGRSEKYIDDVCRKISETVRSAVAEMQSARLRFKQRTVEGLSQNYREPEILDETLTVISVEDQKGLFGAIVNFGCHPEALRRDNLLISADFPGYLVSYLEDSSLDPEALFINGSLGGMVSVTQHGFDGAARIGSDLWFYSMLNLLFLTEALSGSIKIARKEITIPLENPLFANVLGKGIVPSSPATYRDGKLITEVSLIRIGELTIFAVPGEILPRLGFVLKELVNGPSAIFSLANDEIGYILPEGDWARPDNLFNHEKGLSVGPKAGPIILEAFKELLKK